jgi:hypothetical protein
MDPQVENKFSNSFLPQKKDRFPTKTLAEFTLSILIDIENNTSRYLELLQKNI